MTSSDGQSITGRDPMRVTLNQCSECVDEPHGGISTGEAWQAAWWNERARRRRDPKYADPTEEWDKRAWGLDERMVCPRCFHVHADDETSSVEEIEIVLTQAFYVSRAAGYPDGHEPWPNTLENAREFADGHAVNAITREPTNPVVRRRFATAWEEVDHAR